MESELEGVSGATRRHLVQIFEQSLDVTLGELMVLADLQKGGHLIHAIHVSVIKVRG